MKTTLSDGGLLLKEDLLIQRAFCNFLIWLNFVT